MAHIDSTEKFKQAYTGPRPDILQLLPASPKMVLDVGCSDGTLGASIKQHWPIATVIGMELSEPMGAVAAKRIDQVFIGDIEAPESLAGLAGQKFDVVIFADILEHLRDPWKMLGRIRPYLTPDSVVVASIPNVRHIDTIYHLVVKGEWPYRDRGIHDRTHMRFFTKKNIFDMFASEHLEIVQMTSNYRLLERPHPINRHARRFAILGMGPFLAFQYLFVARLKPTN